MMITIHKIRALQKEQRLQILTDIYAETREASQNTDLEMQEFLGIDKALQTMQCEMANNTPKLTKIIKRIKKENDKLS